MHLLNTLYVTTPESRLRLDNDTLRVEIEEETRLRVPLHHLQAVVCFGHVSLSTPLMHKLAESGIALVLLNTNGRFMARLEGAVSGNVLLRQAQCESDNRQLSQWQIEQPRMRRHIATSCRAHLEHHCCSHGTPSRSPSILTPGQFFRNQVASAHEVICEQ